MTTHIAFPVLFKEQYESMDAELLKKIFLFCVEKARKSNAPNMSRLEFESDNKDPFSLHETAFDEFVCDINKKELSKEECDIMKTLSSFVTTVNIDPKYYTNGRIR